jgi:hypothetical protein
MARAGKCETELLVDIDVSNARAVDVPCALFGLCCKFSPHLPYLALFAFTLFSALLLLRRTCRKSRKSRKGRRIFRATPLVIHPPRPSTRPSSLFITPFISISAQGSHPHPLTFSHFSLEPLSAAWWWSTFRRYLIFTQNPRAGFPFAP